VSASISPLSTSTSAARALVAPRSTPTARVTIAPRPRYGSAPQVGSLHSPPGCENPSPPRRRSTARLGLDLLQLALHPFADIVEPLGCLGLEAQHQRRLRIRRAHQRPAILPGDARAVDVDHLVGLGSSGGLVLLDDAAHDVELDVVGQL